MKNFDLLRLFHDAMLVPTEIQEVTLKSIEKFTDNILEGFVVLHSILKESLQVNLSRETSQNKH